MVHRFHGTGPVLTNAGLFTASNNISIRVDHTDHPINAVLHLEHDALEHSARHIDPS